MRDASRWFAPAEVQPLFPGKCEVDPLPLLLQQSVFRAASAHNDVRPALRAWEAMLALDFISEFNQSNETSLMGRLMSTEIPITRLLT